MGTCMKSKLAIFDLDGTLFDTQRVNFRAYQKALAAEGVQLDRDYYQRNCNGKYYKDYLPLLIANPSPDTMERIHDRKKKIYPDCLGEARVNYHLFSLLSLMRDEYHTAIVTTASKSNCYDILRHFHKLEDFDFILTQEDVQRKKPDPEGFLKAMELAKVSPGQTMIFEDSDDGVEAAVRSGATAIRIVSF